jgi:phosphoribosylglycinamide formyltransferase 2
MNQKQSDIRIFGKPTTRLYRRMAVALTYDQLNADVDAVKQRAIQIAKMVTVETNKLI